MTGETLGNYDVLATVGKGAMGEVFLAQHQRIARRTAIKVLAPELTKNPEAVRRFFNEARATSLIRHAGIVEVFDCDVDAHGRAYIVMEYLEGETLGAYLGRTGPLHWPTACTVGRQIADAVGAAHGSGIVHRDLKPENIFLCRSEGRAPSAAIAVKVLDFGIAKLLFADDGADRITRNGVLLGTPRYISPEQCYGAAEVDQRTDVYSLGCIIFEMIVGVPPFTGEGLQALMAAHMFLPPPALSARVPAIPAWLDQLVGRMLAKKPDERPTSMTEVARVLAAGHHEGERPLPLSAQPEHDATPTTLSLSAQPASRLFTRRYPAEPTSHGTKRRRIMVGITGLALAAGGIVALLVALWSPRSAGPASASSDSPVAAAATATADAGVPSRLASVRPVADVARDPGALAPASAEPEPNHEPAPAVTHAAPRARAATPAAASGRRRDGIPSLAPSARRERLAPVAPRETDGIVDL
jgi:eukaryotic-like serine/threonine-protein kinase